MVRGLVLDVQRWSVQDGPGVRTTVFLQGCPLACRWCHNPESQGRGAALVVEPGRCVACGACLEACPRQGIPGPGEPPAPEAGCLLCGACAEACPAEARRLHGRERSAAEVMAEILRDRLYYDETGGGATFSGGEPLAQPDFLLALLRACRAEEVHTAVDTSGFAPAEVVAAVAPLADLFLYDLKLVDDARHRAATGAGSGPVLANLRALDAAGARLRLRIPIVPGWNDDEENLLASAEVAAGLAGLERVDLLPYHAIGRDKYRRLGAAPPLPAIPTPDPARMEELAAPFRRRGLSVTTDGREPVPTR
ncbi:MAG: glycyl-radical enzyme activating protein [Planctomycetota bacterium]|nr:MAG: glycyl-radical enzyme activating protein [Planctomycetota bacterium]